MKWAYGQRVHEAFTALSMRRASIDEIVRAAAEMLATPVVLEDLNHQVLAFDGRDVPAADLLVDWSRRSRLDSEEHWTACKVGSSGRMGPLDRPRRRSRGQPDESHPRARSTGTGP